MLGESEPSAPSRPYMVSGYSGRVYERPVAGPYITFTDAVNETTIMLKWMVSEPCCRLELDRNWQLVAGQAGVTPLLQPFLRPLLYMVLHLCSWELGSPKGAPDRPIGRICEAPRSSRELLFVVCC